MEMTPVVRHREQVPDFWGNPESFLFLWSNGKTQEPKGAKTMKKRKPILEIGIGNILIKDEGIGVRVAEHMMKMSLPPDVEVMDAGTGGLYLLYAIEGRQKR